MSDIEALNREILSLTERLDHVAQKAKRTDSGEIDFTDVTIYGDISNAAKGEKFVEDQKKLESLVSKRNMMVALNEVENWRQLQIEGKSVANGVVEPRQNDLATRIVAAAKSGTTTSVQFSPLEFKALMSTSSGFPPEVLRSSIVELQPQRPLLVLDLPRMIRTTQNAFKFVKESTFTNAAAETSEGGAYPEAALAYTEVSEPVQKIAVHIPVTEEQLEDEPAVEDLIRARLMEMVRQRLDSQILNGNGTAPNLRGVRNVSGINAVAQGTDTVLDAVYKGIVASRTVGFAQPDAIVIHPTNLQAIRLTKTTDGQYIFGAPSGSFDVPIWGLRVVETPAIPAGKIVVGDWGNYSALAMRTNVDVQIGYSGTGFAAGIKTVRCDIRVAFVVFRPAAFSEVTLA